MDLKQIQADALAHYKRMQDWVRTQPLEYRADDHIMQNKIGERWSGNFCSYCKALSDMNNCCPLDAHQENCSCCNGLWEELTYTSTWAEWLEASEKVVEYIKEHGLEDKSKEGEE